MIKSCQPVKVAPEDSQNKRLKGKHDPSNKAKVNSKLCSNVNHKNVTGSNNWENFLKGQGLAAPPTDHPPPHPSLKRKTSNDAGYSKKGLTKAVAIDCEMVGIGEDGVDDMLARVSIVNSFGECLYDTFVSPQEEVTDFRTEVSGVRPEDLKNAKDFETVQKEVAAILCKRIVVGHSLKSDFAVLYLSHPKWLVRDTSHYFRENGKGTPSLKKLAAKYLNASIQEGEHNSVQDAKAAMQLYNMYRSHWESGKGRNKRHNTINNFPVEPQANNSL